MLSFVQKNLKNTQTPTHHVILRRKKNFFFATKGNKRAKITLILRIENYIQIEIRFFDPINLLYILSQDSWRDKFEKKWKNKNISDQKISFPAQNFDLTSANVKSVKFAENKFFLKKSSFRKNQWHFLCQSDIAIWHSKNKIIHYIRFLCNLLEIGYLWVNII